MVNAQFGARKHVVSLNWDLTKMFDFTSLVLLKRSGCEHGFPWEVLQISIGSYLWRRRLLGQGNVASRAARPGRGIAPGSAFAIFEVACVLAVVVLPWLESCPRAQLSVHVDDICSEAAEDTVQKLMEVVVPAARSLADGVENVLGYVLADHKAATVALDEYSRRDPLYTDRSRAASARRRSRPGAGTDPQPAGPSECAASCP